MPPTLPAGEPAAAAAHADLIVRIDLGRRDFAGELLAAGQPVCAFRGWVGLLTALDQALDTIRPPGPDTDAR